MVIILGPICLLVAPLIEENGVRILHPPIVFMATIPLVLFGGATPPYELDLEPFVSYIIMTFPLVVPVVLWDTNVQRLPKL